MDLERALAARDIDEFFTGLYPGVMTEEKVMRLVGVRLEELNGKVRRWIEGNEKQRDFLAKDWVCFFAPATVLEYLSLFVRGKNECGGLFEDSRELWEGFWWDESYWENYGEDRDCE